MRCFYHRADLDGHCSGAIVQHKYPDCNMIGVDYGDNWIEEEILKSPGETTWMVDFSLQPFDRMIRINECLREFIWIDHHKSAIEEHDKFVCNHDSAVKPFIKKLDTTKAACELVWEYIYPEMQRPYSVNLLGRYDIWDERDGRWESRILPFQMGMRIHDTDPAHDKFDWTTFLSSEYYFIQDTILSGNGILTYQAQKNKKLASEIAFETEFEGYTVVAMNTSGSQEFESVYNPEKHAFMLAFIRKPNQWTVLMYSNNDVDVSEIAKKYGGGGHKGAAGFQCRELPFDLSD